MDGVAVVILAKTAPGGSEVWEMAELEKACGLYWTWRMSGWVGLIVVGGLVAVAGGAEGCSTAIGVIVVVIVEVVVVVRWDVVIVLVQRVYTEGQRIEGQLGSGEQPN